jgi:Aspartate carbamoyltransferase, catalytic chain
MREYSRFFGVDDRRVKFAKPDAIILHPGPVNRGVELTTSVVDSEASYINEQVTNGVAVRMAVLNMLTKRSVSE